MRVNSINKLIISPALVKRSRSISYKLNSSNNFVTNCESKFDLIKLIINSKIFDFENFKPRKRYKLNLEIIIYYYRYLGHSKNITQLEKYDINLSKKINDKISYVFYIVKKIA